MRYISILILSSLMFFINCHSDWEKEVIKEVTEMEKFMVETELSGDYLKQVNAYSDDYGYIDISGERTTKEDVKNRRADDNKKSLYLEATELEVVPLSPTLALTRGKWEGISIYYGGIPRSDPSRYMAVWRKENDEWKLLADQGTPILNREIKRPIIELPTSALKKYEGTFDLNTNPGMQIVMRVEADTLRLFIPGKLDDGLPFYPSHDNLFFAKKRPWELNYVSSDSIQFISWGQLTAGIKVAK